MSSGSKAAIKDTKLLTLPLDFRKWFRLRVTAMSQGISTRALLEGLVDEAIRRHEETTGADTCAGMPSWESNK